MTIDISKAVSKFVEAEGFRIHYSVHGAGSPLILLHGGGPGAGGMSNYSKNIAAFAEHYQVYVMDFPGWGKSSKNLEHGGHKSPFQNGGKAVAVFMNALGIKKASIVGNSFGASSAMFLAMDNPDLVDRMVLMGPGGGLIPGATGPTPGILQLLTYYMGEGPTIEKLEAFIQNLIYDKSQITPELLKIRFDASNDPEIKANPPLKIQPGGAPGPETFLSRDPRLASIPHRSLFVWGIDDKVNPWEGVLSFRAIPDHDIVMLSKCGHWVQWEQAEKFNELVLWFLARK